ncbi:MAG: RloB family protein [Chitinophagales bacterium]
MKNKKAEEEAKREQRRAERREQKRRKRQATALEREEATEKKRKSILIYCEGGNTEPSYFRQFRILNADIKAFGEGRNTISLVKRAKRIVDESKCKYDEVWCVFDKDDFLEQNFNEAVRLAKSYGFKVAYSNQAFEYWLILHFEDHQGGAMNRKDYAKKLNGYLNEFNLEYDEDSKIVTEDIFDVLQHKVKVGNKMKTRQELACERAKRIYEWKQYILPAKQESVTTVYRFFEENNIE